MCITSESKKENNSSRHELLTTWVDEFQIPIFSESNKSCSPILIYLSEHRLVKKIRERMWWITQYYAIISSLVYFNIFCSPSYIESRSHWNCCNDHWHRECCHQDWVRNLKFVPCTKFNVKSKEYCWSNEFIRPSVCAVIKQLE